MRAFARIATRSHPFSARAKSNTRGAGPRHLPQAAAGAAPRRAVQQAALRCSSTSSHSRPSASHHWWPHPLSVAASLGGAAVLTAAVLPERGGVPSGGRGLRVGPVVAHAEAAGEAAASKTKLYPLPEACLEEGWLEVSDTHAMYYHTYGNPKGKPVLFIHGGPGGGTDPVNARFFDPEAYYIVLADQRGCGKSTPFASLEDNTTWHLVEDYEKLRAKLGVDKWMIFGGSWGSTLALAYSQTYPHRCTELVLRGIFTLRASELDWFYEGQGANHIFPDEWERYVAAIPAAERAQPGFRFQDAYGRRLRGELGDQQMRNAAKVWSMWEGRTSKLVPDPAADERFGADDFSLAFARIENHFFVNKGFFERDGQLLEEPSIRKIAHLPLSVVQGRYDVVCPMRTAWDLKQVWEKVSDGVEDFEFVVTTTGHSALEAEIADTLVRFTDKYKPCFPDK